MVSPHSCNLCQSKETSRSILSQVLQMVRQEITPYFLYCLCPTTSWVLFVCMGPISSQRCRPTRECPEVCLKSLLQAVVSILSGVTWYFSSVLPAGKTRKCTTSLHVQAYIIHNIIDFPVAPIHFKNAPPYGSRNRNPLALKLYHCHTSKFLNSYFPRTSSCWNNLPADTVTSTSIVSFKYGLT